MWRIGLLAARTIIAAVREFHVLRLPENARQIPQRGLRQGPLLGPFQFGFEGDHPFKVLVDLIFIDDEVLYLSWVDFGFACPWFPSFEAALAANPFPLPFNGVDWPAQDCIFAPAP